MIRKVFLLLLFVCIAACSEDPTAPVGDFFSLEVQGSLEITDSNGSPLKLGALAGGVPIKGTMEIAAAKQSKEGLLVTLTELDANAQDPQIGLVTFDYDRQVDQSGTLYFSKSGGPLGVSFLHMTLLMTLSDGQVLNLGAQLFEAREQNPFILSLVGGIPDINFSFNGGPLQANITEINLVMSEELVDALN